MPTRRSGEDLLRFATRGLVVDGVEEMILRLLE